MAEGAEERASRLGSEAGTSCVPYFDALWFCYSPVHQLQEYYMHGKVDDCLGHWSDFYNCLKRRTKFAGQVPVDPNAGKHPLWTLRSKAEAEETWQREFGHLDGMPANVSQAESSEHQDSKTETDAGGDKAGQTMQQSEGGAEWKKTIHSGNSATKPGGLV